MIRERKSFKRQRIEDAAGSLRGLLNDPRLPLNSLCRLADKVSKDPDILQSCTWNNVNNIVRREYEAFNTTLVMDTSDGGVVTLALCEPNMLLMHLLQEAPQRLPTTGRRTVWHGRAI